MPRRCAAPRAGAADPRRAQLRGSGGAGHRQRPAHGLLGRGADHAPGGAHGTARHPGQYPPDGGDPAAGGGAGAGQGPGAGPVKGLAEPVEVFELVGASAHPAALAGRRGAGADPLCRAAAGAGALQQALAQAGAGHGQVVALVGEAGVGKSRLVYEFVPFPPHAGLAGAGERLGVLRQGHAVLPRASTCSSATATSRSATTRAPSGPR